MLNAPAFDAVADRRQLTEAIERQRATALHRGLRCEFDRK